MKKRFMSLGVVLATVMFAGHVSAQSALKDEAEVRNGIIWAGMAYEISQKCDSIDVRMFRGLGYLNGLRDRARALGYSEEQIAAYLDDRAEKRRLEAIARGELARLGAGDDPQSYCAVGRAQIAANTRVGCLLR